MPEALVGQPILAAAGFQPALLTRCRHRGARTHACRVHTRVNASFARISVYALVLLHIAFPSSFQNVVTAAGALPMLNNTNIDTARLKSQTPNPMVDSK
jgi:hypothetical protein